MTRYELVDWTPARFPTVPVHPRLGARSRKNLAFLVNMHLRKAGTKYIHNGSKP